VFGYEGVIGVESRVRAGSCDDEEYLEVEARGGALAFRGVGLTLGKCEGKEGGTESRRGAAVDLGGEVDEVDLRRDCVLESRPFVPERPTFFSLLLQYSG
jgi:hypothetical protein